MTIVSASRCVPTCAAHALTAPQRLTLALDSLSRDCCISHLAETHDVSRKFVYAQQHKALDALRWAFDPPHDAPEVLFHLGVTKDWLRQFVLAATLVGHAAQRGAVEMIGDLFGLRVSLGWVNSVVRDAIGNARAVNQTQDLSRVGAVALDEIFQSGEPTLAVVDVGSTYCCLLSQEDGRDAQTWALRLLELQDQGLAPRSAVADFGSGLRAGSHAAWPHLSCDADVWHALHELGGVVRFLENRAYAAIETHDKLCRRGGDAEPIRHAKGEQDRAIALADDVASLLSWLAGDVLSLAGPSLAGRQELFDFVLGQLQQRRASCEHRLGPVCSLLNGKQGEALLGFCKRLDRDVADLAVYARVSEAVVREMIQVQEMARTDGRRWQLEGALRRQLGDRYETLSEQVEALREGVVRASSVVENLNSRLRSYFFLRKEVGGGYLDLLRFFLNHRKFQRSAHAGRVGKSPAELLSGAEHPHWLTMLGYRRFRQQQQGEAA